MTDVGFIDLTHMGFPIARRLLDAVTTSSLSAPIANAPTLDHERADSNFTSSDYTDRTGRRSHCRPR
jgi:hypothetical protein